MTEPIGIPVNNLFCFNATVSANTTSPYGNSTSRTAPNTFVKNTASRVSSAADVATEWNTLSIRSSDKHSFDKELRDTTIYLPSHVYHDVDFSPKYFGLNLTLIAVDCYGNTQNPVQTEVQMTARHIGKCPKENLSPGRNINQLKQFNRRFYNGSVTYEELPVSKDCGPLSTVLTQYYLSTNSVLTHY